MMEEKGMHLNSELALDLTEGRLERTMEDQWTVHVADCLTCSAELNRWKTLRPYLNRSHLQNAPESVLQSAYALFPARQQQQERPNLRQVVAELFYDSLLQPAFAGARGEISARHVVLRAEEFDIHVRIRSTTTESREVMGQIQPRRSSAFVKSARLYLIHNGERFCSTDVNELGEFHFGYVPDGLLSLQIDLPHLTVIGAIDAAEVA